MKFRIYWTESHNPDNWGDTYEKGRKNIFNSFPNATISEFWTQMNNDEWLDLDCWETYEAKTPREAVEQWKEDYYAETFSVFKEGEYKEPIFTEEDLVEV